MVQKALVAPITPAAGYSYVSGVQVREALDPLETLKPAPMSEPVSAHINALVEVIELATKKGLAFNNVEGSPWTFVDVFPFMTKAHWNAFAREARVPSPDQKTRRATRAAYRARVGYDGPEVKDDTVDEVAP